MSTAGRYNLQLKDGVIDAATEIILPVIQNVLLKTLHVEDASAYNNSMPPYFRFFTLMALRVFLHEEVDVAVMEVGIGGRFDSTNVIPTPVACGITPLGYDHVDVLGHTIEEIAWRKAGIMKRGCKIAVTAPGQPESAHKVLQAEADAVGIQLTIAPDLNTYLVPKFANSPPKLGIQGPPQQMNASMALQLTETFLRHRDQRPPVTGPFTLDDIHMEALRRTQWPGRCSVLQRNDKLRLHLDGAHTVESLESCVQWFSEVSRGPRVLVFNITGHRDIRAFMPILQKIAFDYAIFCPNLIDGETSNSPGCGEGTDSNLQKVFESRSAQLKVCESLLTEWRRLCGDNPPSAVFQSVTDVLKSLDNLETQNLPQSLVQCDHMDVLITGSLYLVGKFYAVVNPDLDL